jgi:hypothetical protein
MARLAQKSPDGDSVGASLFRTRWGDDPLERRLCDAHPAACDGEHKTTLLLFRRLRQQSRQGSTATALPCPPYVPLTASFGLSDRRPTNLRNTWECHADR